MIIGIHGKAGSGKDTFASFLIEEAEGYSFNRLAFADPVYDCVDIIFRIKSREIVDKEALVEGWPFSLREMLQKVGTDMARNVIGDNIWVENMMMRIEEASEPNTIITDVRYENEANYIKRERGVVIFVRSNKNHRNQVVRDHDSEDGMCYERADLIVANTGGLDNLKTIAGTIATELAERGKLLKS
jgi:hypothetical protein